MRDSGAHEVASRTCKTGGLGQGWLADGLSVASAGAESLGPPSLPPVELGLARMHYVPTAMLQARRSRKGPLPLVAVCLPGRTWDTNIASLMQVRELKSCPKCVWYPDVQGHYLSDGGSDGRRRAELWSGTIAVPEEDKRRRFGSRTITNVRRPRQ